MVIALGLEPKLYGQKDRCVSLLHYTTIMVEEVGLEPTTTESKSVVLPVKLFLYTSKYIFIVPPGPKHTGGRTTVCIKCCHNLIGLLLMALRIGLEPMT